MPELPTAVVIISTSLSESLATTYTLDTAGASICLETPGVPVMLRTICLDWSDTPFKAVKVTFPAVTSMLAKPAMACSIRVPKLVLVVIPH
jgi:hypothetical protein